MQNDQMEMITTCLTENFVKPIYARCGDRNYYTYVLVLDEILHWAEEFYALYRGKLTKWEDFRKSRENIFNANRPDEFIIAWGNNRLKLFLDGQKSSSGVLPIISDLA